MNVVRESFLKEQLLFRKQRLQHALQEFREAKHISHLLSEIDEALVRLNNGTYGLCETCNDPIEAERLISNPLARLCLDHLTRDQRAALEHDLELASKIQSQLLPQKHIVSGIWDLRLHYQPAGPVSGDYCDIFLTGTEGELYFIFGDVSGKGIAASLLMSHLHALFRSMISLHLPFDQLIARANRVFSESTLASHYATLVFGKTEAGGGVTICNAGHCPPVLIRDRSAEEINPTGIPFGIFTDSEYELDRRTLHTNELLFLYTDGVSETRNQSLEEYGSHRLLEYLRSCDGRHSQQILNELLEVLDSFRDHTVPADDLTLLVLRRNGR